MKRISLVLILAAACGDTTTGAGPAPKVEDPPVETPEPVRGCEDIRLEERADGRSREPATGWQHGDELAVVWAEYSVDGPIETRLVLEWFSLEGESLERIDLLRSSADPTGVSAGNIVATPDGTHAMQVYLNGLEWVLAVKRGEEPVILEHDDRFDVRALGWDGESFIVLERADRDLFVVQHVSRTGEQRAGRQIPSDADRFFVAGASGGIYGVSREGQLTGWSIEGTGVAGPVAGPGSGIARLAFAETAEGVSVSNTDGADLVWQEFTSQLEPVGEEGRIAGAYADTTVQTARILPAGSTAWRMYGAAENGVTLLESDVSRRFLVHAVERCEENPACDGWDDRFSVMALRNPAEPWVIVGDRTGSGLGEEGQPLVYRIVRADDECTYRSVFLQNVDG